MGSFIQAIVSFFRQLFAGEAPLPMDNSAAITLSVLNDASQKAIVYVGESATLDVEMANNSGNDIAFAAGTKPARFDLYLPTFYTVDDLKNMVISLTNWKFSVDDDAIALKLEYSSQDKGSWGQGSFAALRFQITGASSKASADTQPVQVVMNNFTSPGTIPQVDNFQLSLMDPPIKGNPKLPDVLEVTLQHEGTVYVSCSVQDTIPNTLFLNFKNKIIDYPLFRGTAWPSKPQVIVSFVYGSTSGALAPDADKRDPQTGSAWNIKSIVAIGEGNDWAPTDPDKNGQREHPRWLLTPNPTKLGIIGTGENANITFAFSNIVSITPPGPTQMIVQFSDFPYDDQKNYDDHIFVVNIDKMNPPPNRGIINFFNANPNIVLNSPTDSVTTVFNWALFQVSAIKLTNQFMLDVPEFKKTYSSSNPVVYDSPSIQISGFTQSVTDTFVLDALDGQGIILNSQTFPLFITANFFLDPRDQQVYQITQVGKQTWMAQNLNFKTGSGSIYYNNKPQTYEKPYGLLYDWPTANQNIPAGWRLPSAADWQTLIGHYATPAAAYTALIQGGGSEFNAQLGGWYQPPNPPTPFAFNDMAGVGYYWTASEADANAAQFACFSLEQGALAFVNEQGYPNGSYFSVRYIKND